MLLPLSYSVKNLTARPLRTAMSASVIALVVVACSLFLGLISSLERTVVTSGDPLNLVVLRKGSGNDGSSQLSLAFNRLLMRDSSNFHAVCLDTYPPLVYLNQFSFSAMAFVHRFNKALGHEAVGYTFDAGPNPFFFVHRSQAGDFVDKLTKEFHLNASDLVITKILILIKASNWLISFKF